MPQLPQRQDALDDQLGTLHRAAVKLGCYDADDWLRAILEHRKLYRKAHESEDRYL